MIKSLVDQYSLPEVISCVFSNPCKHKELRKIIDFLIKEEGKLNIIQYLLHLNEFKPEEINSIQELDDSKGENIELIENIPNIPNTRLREKKMKLQTLSNSSSKSSKSNSKANSKENILNKEKNGFCRQGDYYTSGNCAEAQKI